MAGNGRFHDKLHRRNHHTSPSDGFLDSANDPIASPSEPFLGDFILSGSLSSYNTLIGQTLKVNNSLYLPTSTLVTSLTNISLSINSPTYFFIDANGTPRNIELPLITNQKGLTFIIKNISATSNNLHVHYNGNLSGSPIVSINKDLYNTFIAGSSNSTWNYL